jgi:hypothetical protein
VEEVKRTLDITARHVGPADSWFTKEEIAEIERSSRTAWSELDDEQRQAILLLTRDALVRLIEEVNDWVPTSFVPESGHRLDLWITVHLAEVDEEVLRRRVEAEKAISATTTDLKRMREELGQRGETE